jgi:hypothetical protein
MTQNYSFTAQFTYSKTLNYGDNSAEYGPYDIASQYGAGQFTSLKNFALPRTTQFSLRLDF